MSHATLTAIGRERNGSATTASEICTKTLCHFGGSNEKNARGNLFRPIADMDMTVIFKSDAQVPRMRANSITFVNLSSSTPTRALSGSIGIARESSGNDW